MYLPISRRPVLSLGLFRQLAALFAAAVLGGSAFATINAALQMQSGNPSNATADPNNHAHFLIQRAQYAMDYNDTTREPNWVAWDLTSDDVGGSGRSDFQVDTTLPAGFYQVLTTDYSGSGYDRGHMCPSADRTVTVADNQQVFYMSNMIPQAPDNNQGVWANFENYCRSVAAAGNELLIISGPSEFAGSTIASGVAIPGYTWKIVVVVPLGAGTALDRINAAGAANIRVIAVRIPNIQGVRGDPWQNYITNVSTIESKTGFRFFTGLPTAIADALRIKFDGQTATGAPAIVTAPSTQSAPVGGSATFTVSATATDPSPLTYQWLKDDTEIPGATSATLTISNVQATDAGNYDVVVTNAVGSATSSSAALVVTGLPPMITTSPSPITGTAGATAVFSVTVSGSPTLTYVWRKDGATLANGGNVAGATSATLTLSNIQATDIASYDVVVTNSAGNATSTAATLSVTPAAPTITTQPTAQSTSVGGTAAFTVTATGTSGFTYQWFKGATQLVNAGNVSGATSATLSLTNVQTTDAGAYSVVVTNSVNSATSNPAALTVSTGAGSLAKLVIGGYLVDTLSTDTPFEYVQLVATAPIDFSLTPFTVVAANNGTASVNGWRAGGSITYAFSITSGTMAKGDVAYVGGSGKLIDGAGSTDISSLKWLRTITTTTVAGDSFGNANSSGVFGNGGTADGIAVFDVAAPAVTATTIPVDAIFYGSSVGIAKPASGGYVLPTNDHYTNAQGTFGNGTNTFLFPDNISSVFFKLNGVYDATAGQWTTPRTASNTTLTAASPITALTSGVTVTQAAAPTAPAVASTTPAAGATDIATNSPISVTFNQGVNVAGAWFGISSATNGTVAATVTGGPTTFTLTPPVSFANSDTVTVTLFASQITDSASNTLHPAANTTFSFTTAASNAATPPTVTTQPVAQTVNAGGTATFTVAASGTAPLSYQWRQNGNAISGNASATTATLTLTGVTPTTAGDYSCVVSNSGGSDVSAAATLTVIVISPPTITASPVAQSVLNGTPVSFTVAASGTGPLTYQWRKAGVALVNSATVTGVTSATLSFSPAGPSDPGSYDVVVTNSGGSVASAPATLTVSAGQIAYTGGTYTQDFNTLPAATGTFTLAGSGPHALFSSNPAAVIGWTVAKVGGTGANELFNVGSGSGNSGSIYSFGTGASTDRALGMLLSGAVSSDMGVTLVNNTGGPLTRITISYTGEQWRYGKGTSGPDKIQFEYLLGGTSIATGTFTAATQLDFASPVSSGTAAVALDGNANSSVVTATLTGLTWAPGQTLVLRWKDLDVGGSDDGLAIDDFSFTALPPAAPVVATTTPANGGTNVPLNSAITVTFDQPVATTGNWFALTSAATGPIAATVSGGPTTFTFTPAAPFAYSDTIGVTLFASQITETVTGTVHPAADYAFSFTTIPPTPPSIVTPPTSQTATVGDGVTFNVVASGTAPLGYQWRKGGIAIADNASATTDTLALANITTADAGDYDVVVINVAGSATSGAATLTVNKAVASVTLGNLTATYDGTPKPVTVGTTPGGLGFTVTYNNSATVPTNAGTYNVVATIVDANYVGGATATLTINRAPATVTLGSLNQTYTGSPLSASATTVPASLAVGFSYNNSATVPTNAGTYAVVATIANPNYIGGASGTLVIAKATATVALSNTTQTYDGTPKPVTITTTPAGLAASATYDTNATVPTNAGTYAVAVSITDSNYSGSTTGSLTIDKAVVPVVISNLHQTFDGTPKPVTTATTPAGLTVNVTYDSSPVAPSAAGSYAVVASISNANYRGSSSATLVIGQATATIVLGDLAQVYDGTMKAVTTTTTPAGLAVTVTYNGSATAPTNPGSYAVVATTTDPNYSATISGTLVITSTALVRHAPSLDGGLDGSLQVLTGESLTLNGNAWVSGDILVPGTPTVRLNGHPTFAGTQDGTGSATPSNYQVTLNGNAVLRHLVRRTDPIAMPVVAAPAAPTGTRNVSLNSASDSAGDFATIRNLTLNGNAGTRTVPAGTYGAITVNGNSGLVLGIAGSTTPAVYQLQGLTLNGNAQIQIAGPVVIVLGSGVSLNGDVGAAAHPEWLTLNVASGGVTLNGNVTFNGSVVAPNGTVVINGNTTLNGSVVADRLTLNGNSVLNQP